MSVYSKSFRLTELSFVHNSHEIGGSPIFIGAEPVGLLQYKHEIYE